MPQLEQQLQTMRQKEKTPDEYFPAKLNRVMLGNAEKMPIEKIDGLCTVAYQALYGHIRFPFGKVFDGPVATLAERVTMGFPRFYAAILPCLRTEKTDAPKVFKILVREVFMPTFFLEMKLAQLVRRDPSNELGVDSCWYLPTAQNGEKEYPFQRVLKAWLNAAGYRYAHDVGKILDSDSKRRLIENWLRGDHPPFGKMISRMVDGFKGGAKRFDTDESWKGRLLFAAAMQRLLKKMDRIEAGFSFLLLGMLQEIERECIPIDDGEVLAKTRTFFAARLYYQRISKTEMWQRRMANISESQTLTFPDSATNASIRKRIAKKQRDMNMGNFLLQLMIKEAKAKPGTVDQQIFALGIDELNRFFV